MRREKAVVLGVFLLSFLLWGLDVGIRYSSTDWSVWLWRKELINLTGVLALIPMGFIMLLALRPKFLEPFFNGMDKIYYIHKWVGIWAIVAALLHYGIKLSKSFLRPFFERGPKIKAETIAWLDDYRSLAKDVGEILFYLFAIMLVVTLLKKIPYRFWRKIHKLMGLFFLAVVFHTIVLAPARYWTEPVGIAFIIVMAIGVYAAIVSLFGQIGRGKRYEAKIKSLDFSANSAIVDCEMPAHWTHVSGQYAFVQHPTYKERHPFTIASSVHDDQTIRFAIKELGHYTRKISSRWKVGDTLNIEGPYGRFSYETSLFPKQIWIAGGVGITPFIAWLESLQCKDTKYAITLYYLVKNQDEALMVDYLVALAERAGVTLYVHYSDEKGHLDFKKLPFDAETSVWFCGPTGIAKAIRSILKSQNLSPSKYFHCEYFEMR